MTLRTTKPFRSGVFAIVTVALLAVVAVAILWFPSPKADGAGAAPPAAHARVQAPPGIEEALAARNAIDESEPEGRFVGAARAGDIDEVRRMLAEGVSPDAREPKNGHGALHQAARSGSLAVVDLLLDNGADVNAPDGTSLTPLMRAALSASVPVGRRLLEAGADANAQHEPERQTALSQLVGGQFLLRAQGQPDVGAPERQEFAKMLFEHGADPNAASEDGSPLRIVIAMQDAAMLALFLEHGGQVADIADIQVFRRLPGPVGEMLRKAISQTP